MSAWILAYLPCFFCYLLCFFVVLDTPAFFFIDLFMDVHARVAVRVPILTRSGPPWRSLIEPMDQIKKKRMIFEHFQNRPDSFQSKLGPPRGAPQGPIWFLHGAPWETSGALKLEMPAPGCPDAIQEGVNKLLEQQKVCFFRSGFPQGNIAPRGGHFEECGCGPYGKQ